MRMEKNKEKTIRYVEKNLIYRPYGEKLFIICAYSNQTLSVDELLTF